MAPESSLSRDDVIWVKRPEVAMAQLAANSLPPPELDLGGAAEEEEEEEGREGDP